MQSRPALTATVITLNEANNLARCLESLAWTDEILVVDSGSTDNTCEIARKYGAKVMENSWVGYGQQKNFAMEQATNDWILSVDADEVVSEDLKNSIENFLRSSSTEQKNYGAKFPRKTWYLDRWIMHGGWYPDLSLRLCHRKFAQWTTPAVHETLKIEGNVLRLEGELLHYTFRDVGDQVLTNVKYARLGTKVSLEKEESWAFIKAFVKPPIKFIETYVWRAGFLDGFPGFVISVNAAHSIFMKYIGLYFEQNSRHR